MSPGDSLDFRNSARITLLVLAGIWASAGTAAADMWQPGDMITYTQVSWPEDSVAESLLTDDYASVYAPMSDVLQVGWSSGYMLSFGDALDVDLFMPQAGIPAALDQNQTNPAAAESGLFGGDVLALQLDVDFSDAGLLVGASGLRFGDLILTNFVFVANFNGLTVRQLLSHANVVLGGGPHIYPISVLDTVVEEVNISFDGGQIVTQFAQDHLIAPNSQVSSTPEPASWVLLSTGLLGIAASRRWQRRRQERAAPQREIRCPV